MNKKGFTLIELLATIAILAIISIIAVPNVIKIMDSNKKEKVLNDGITLISMAKQEISSNRDLRDMLDSVNITRTLDELDENNNVTTDSDGISYNRSLSYVNIAKTNGVITYCVYLESDNWILSSSGNCVLEDNLWGDNAKQYVNEA